MKLNHLLLLSITLTPLCSYAMDIDEKSSSAIKTQQKSSDIIKKSIFNEEEVFKNSFEDIKELLKEKNIDLNKIKINENLETYDPTYNPLEWIGLRERTPRIEVTARELELKDILPAMSRGLAIGIFDTVADKCLNVVYNIIRLKIQNFSEEKVKNIMSLYTDADFLAYAMTYLPSYILPSPIDVIFKAASYTSMLRMSTYSSLGETAKEGLQQTAEAISSILREIFGNLKTVPLTANLLKNDSLLKNPADALQELSPLASQAFQILDSFEKSKLHPYDPFRLYNKFMEQLNGRGKQLITKVMQKETTMLPEFCTKGINYLQGIARNSVLEDKLLPNFSALKEEAISRIHKFVNENIPETVEFSEIEEVFKSEGELIGESYLKNFLSNIAQENGINVNDLVNKPTVQSKFEKRIGQCIYQIFSLGQRASKPFVHFYKCYYGEKSTLPKKIIIDASTAFKISTPLKTLQLPPKNKLKITQNGATHKPAVHRILLMCPHGENSYLAVNGVVKSDSYQRAFFGTQKYMDNNKTCYTNSLSLLEDEDGTCRILCKFGYISYLAVDGVVKNDSYRWAIFGNPQHLKTDKASYSNTFRLIQERPDTYRIQCNFGDTSYLAINGKVKKGSYQWAFFGTQEYLDSNKTAYCSDFYIENVGNLKVLEG